MFAVHTISALVPYEMFIATSGTKKTPGAWVVNHLKTLLAVVF